MSACAACAAPLLDGDRFCEECGASVAVQSRACVDLGVAAAVTEQGRTHRRNEDAYELLGTPSGVAAVICDGISTSLSGDLAARAAASAAARILAEALRGGGGLVDATRAGSAAARAAVRRVPWTTRSELALPSCTLVCAACRGGEVVIGWIGDSRAYWLAVGDARRLTVDDSWATEQISDGVLSPAEAAADRRAHALTRWVGADAPDDGPQVMTFHPAAPGRLILCSDGLWNYAPEPQDLAAILAGLPPAAGAAAVAQRLAGTAMERGGRDDITVAVIDIEPEKERSPVSRFAAETYQNEFLPAGAGEVNAVVTVTALDRRDDHDGTAAEIIIIDASGSMVFPSTKLKAARQATGAALDALRDGVLFAVIAGADRARTVYPRTGLVAASATTRAEAKRAVGRLTATGGTAIGSWLRLADELFATAPAALRHAILLTDGQNRHETEEDLTRVLRDCEGRFQCDCRGVGTDWEVAELRRIASALLGTVDIIADPLQMEADFRAMTERAMARGAGDVALRLWTPQGAEVAFVKQVAPAIEDLTVRAVGVDALTHDYPTGAWGGEARDYHLCIKVRPRETGDEVLAGRLSLVVDGAVVSQALIRAVWTDDEQLSTRINPEVAHYTGQAELAKAIQDGLEARKAGDEAEATFKLGRAVQLAHAGGNDATMKLLKAVVDVDDSGTLRLKREVADVDEMSLDTRSTKTVRVQKAVT